MNQVIEWLKSVAGLLDAAGWAIVISMVSAAFTFRGLRWQKKNAQAAQRSAAAAERSAAADEKMLEATLKAANAEEKAAAYQQLAADLTVAPPASPADVSWQIEHATNALYLLRNVGSQTATGVTADPEPFKGFARQLPEGAAVRAKESVEFLLVQVAQESTPHEMWLTWDGQDEPVAVPIPTPSNW